MNRSTFRSDQPLVGTYFFYWYDAATHQHFMNPDGSDALTHHPLNADGYSFRSADWFERELGTMREAGLDFVMPVFWGYPNDYASWSFEGLPRLVEAWRRLEARQESPPRIGLFYDTTTLRWNRSRLHADLTTEKGRQWFYETVRDFYSMLPPDLWATVDGRPLVWLYTAGFVQRQDPAALDYLRQAFANDFGLPPFVVKEVSWQGHADAEYAWGAALQPNLLGIAAVGPGYDHSAVPGRTPLVRDREQGAFYIRSWQWILSRPPARRPAIAVVETWNEFHEGTEIAPTREDGRHYVELTRRFADLWHQGAQVPRQGPYAQVGEVSVTLGATNRESGLTQRESDDGVTVEVTHGGRPGRTTVATGRGGRYIYFDIDNSFFYADGEPVEVRVDYWDEGTGSLVLEYDSTDKTLHHEGAFKAARPQPLKNSRHWKSCRWLLADAAFAGRANGHDFRLTVPEGQAVVAAVQVIRQDRQGAGTPGR